ncbi:MAG: hypothetical protein QF682_10970 [Candidatus Thermoplasmatota archaeon]|jgi:tRNA wybutosine-synthesizing protein 3|nr:hypothetical protein [Candidatus Thermoplasmatota archaeon]
MIANREERLVRLDESIQEGKVDPEAIPILNLINSNSKYLTTSSCSGRIQLISLREVGGKKDSRIVAKWHSPVKGEDFGSALTSWKDNGSLYLMAQSPIFHVEADDLMSAITLRNLAQANGFKYSTIRSIKLNRANGEPVKITVEILSSENLHTPLGENAEIIANSDYIEFLRSRANHHFSRGKMKLRRLEKGLSLNENI